MTTLLHKKIRQTRPTQLHCFGMNKDRLSKERRSWNMSRIRGKNTKPEMIVRSLLHRMGYRFRLHVKIFRAARMEDNFVKREDSSITPYLLSRRANYWNP